LKLKGIHSRQFPSVASARPVDFSQSTSQHQTRHNYLDIGLPGLHISLARNSQFQSLPSCPMITTLEQIQEVAQRIGKEFSPQRIILFGSYAYGNPTPDSDVDLLVITPFQGRSAEKSVEIRLKVRPPFPMDLLVRTPEKVQERLNMGDSFMREILMKGKVLYEAADA